MQVVSIEAKEELWPDGRVKYRYGGPNDWFKVYWHDGTPIYRRDADKTMFCWNYTRIYYSEGWPDIGYNDLNKFLKRIMPKLKKDWPEEYKYWEDKLKYMYYVDNNLDYEVESFLQITIYKPKRMIADEI